VINLSIITSYSLPFRYELSTTNIAISRTTLSSITLVNVQLPIYYLKSLIKSIIDSIIANIGIRIIKLIIIYYFNLLNQRCISLA
jgi:hypothetical protein